MGVENNHRSGVVVLDKTLKIMNILRNGRRTIVEISQEVGMSTKHVRRYIHTLELNGIPVQVIVPSPSETRIYYIDRSWRW